MKRFLKDPAHYYHHAIYQLAKCGWRLMTIWMRAQRRIDGDTVQIEEILAEWLKEL